MKSKFLLTLSILFALAFASLTFAGEWVADGANWKYQNDNGEFLQDVQKVVDGKWYTFDENGYMLKGFVEYNGKFYYLNEDGTPVSGSITYNGKKYNITEKGEVRNISEEDFYGYQDSISQKLITGGGYTTNKANDIEAAASEAKAFFQTLPLSKRAFKVIYKEKGYNDDAISYMLTIPDLNWKEQAVKVAKEYYDKSQFDRTEMRSILITEGFSENEAKYGTELAFGNDTFSSGVGKQQHVKVMAEYLDKMSLAIMGQKISDIAAAKKAVKESESAAAAAAAKAVDPNTYSIKNKTSKTLQLNLADDDVESGKVKVKITLPVPEFDGPRAVELNALVSDQVFGVVEKYLENYYYDAFRYDRKYKADDVKISSQNAEQIILTFYGDYTVELTIYLTTMTFKTDLY